jgi:hypothetical protein
MIAGAGRATPKSREQSDNVYENKGQVQKVAEPYIARPNAAAHIASRAQVLFLMLKRS